MKVQLPEGIASISGTLSRSRNHRLVAKTFNKADGTKETRFYMMPKHERSTPVSDKEIAQRNRLATAAARYNALSEDEKKQYARECKAAQFIFKGKQYNTFRGYTIARLMNP